MSDQSPTSRTRRPRPQTRPRAPLTALTAVVVALLCAVTAAAQAKVLPIDPWPQYEPQKTCSPTAKKGTTMLANWLMATYKGSGSLGISRACSDGGTSEHKEGRAFDWALDATSARDRRFAADFISRLKADDVHGNHDALARRMGIMYLIWNDHIYSMYPHGNTPPMGKRLYNGCGAKDYHNCGVTLRHRNHMHISLTWRGARAKASWYQMRLGHGKITKPADPTPNPAPNPTPDPTPGGDTNHDQPRDHQHQHRRDVHRGRVLDLSNHRVVKLHVAGNGEVTSTGRSLEKGRAYKLTMFGLYRYGPNPQDVSDAACVWSPVKHAFVARPAADVKAAYGSLNVLVNRKNVLTGECNTKRHIYQVKLVPKRTDRLKLKVATRGGTAAVPSGGVTALLSGWQTRVSKLIPKPVHARSAPAPRPVDDSGVSTVADFVQLDAAAGHADTAQTLSAGIRYRITVSGVVDLGDGVYSDGQCIYSEGRWTQQMSLDLAVPDADHGNLYVDGQPFAGQAPQGDVTGCAAHTHSMVYTPGTSGRASVALWDPFTRTDNRGTLSITVERLDKVKGLKAAAAQTGHGRAWYTGYESVTVDTSSRKGAVTTMMFDKGERVRLYASGSYRDGGRNGDAGCVTRGSRFTNARDANGQFVGRLYVEGQPVQWTPLHGRDGCDYGHSYRAEIVAKKSGPLSLALLDLDYSDNSGTLTVLVVRN